MKEDIDSDNEADIEPDPEEDYPWELNFNIMGQVENNNNVPSEGEWCINKDFIMAYLSDESSKNKQIKNDIDACTDPWRTLCAEASLTLSIKSSFNSDEEVEDARKAFFKVPSKRKGKKPIHFDKDAGGEEELIEPTNDPWIKHLNILWDIRFEQRDLPTEDKVIQVNMGSEFDPKPIFISEILSPSKKEDLISLIREYIDVFVWNYEDMHGLNPKVAMHRLNIDPDAKPVKQQQRRFRPEIMKAIELEIKKVIDSGFVREEQHPDWVANIVPVPKKNDPAFKGCENEAKQIPSTVLDTRSPFSITA
ncbi:uncharacterized protein A4U43_C04F22330 [Asparagus officinalis]|uniref:Uncharacterized protein n=1 Tax=Asparagus officinalis TaxID=4686 RepID=A0A5P1F881_ASPOF|nr:uncharacterized protein A4U43_C04F22330 [Asparagus officinalis]